jgi:glycosyltransferase involved in cell wall biosynthesis
MKIALVCPASLPATQFGGILFLCVDIARELSNENHDVTIYTTDLDFANNPKTFNKNLPRTEIIDKFKIKRSHVWLSLKLFFINPGMYFQMVRDDADIIHTVGVRSFQSYVAALAAKKKGIPLIISDQGGLTTHPDLRSNFLNKILYKCQKPMINFIINQASKISVANEYEEKIFTECGAKSKIKIIRNGINLRDFESVSVNFREKYDVKDRFILFVGRFSHIKGIDMLIRAISTIKDHPEMQKTKLVIMGVDFGFESTMIQMINEHKIEDKVILIRKPPREYVIAAYSLCEFLVLPSRWELSPLTPLEGFAFKKPTISTWSHGIPHTVTNEETGILVEPENHDQLAKAIIELLTNDEKRTKYGNAGYDLVRNTCNSKIMAKNTLQLYEETLH